MSNHIIECAKDNTQGRNTGAKEQCLEGVEVRNALATTEQEFETATAAKSLANWKTARDEKKIIPLFEMEDVANADTEDTKKELRDRTIITKFGKKIRTFNAYISLCSHYALKSYDGKKMRYYGFTDKQEIKAVSPDGTKVRGQLVTLTVGRRVDAVADNPAYTPITVTYADHNEFEDNGVILRPDWSHIDLDGIFDVKLKLVSATSASIKFKALVGCGGGDEPVTTLESDDVILKNASGATQAPTFVDADADGVYELTGTGFANNYTLSLNGVVAKTEASYEAVSALTITGIS